MGPELGKYAVWVLSAYGVSLALLAMIVVLSAMQSRRTRRALQAMEEGRARTTPHSAGPTAAAQREALDG